jgi:hypothetical protein
MATRTHGAGQTLTSGQFFILAIYGIILWFAAAMLVRTLAPVGALQGGWGAVTYAMVIPATVPAIIAARALARLRSDQTISAIAVVTATALLFDGIAHGWFSSIYGKDPALIVKGTGVIFWGAGIGLLLAFFFNKECTT